MFFTLQRAADSVFILGAMSALPFQPFQLVHRVTYADCTAGNHVYYARYLEFLELARGEFFRHLGTTCLQWQEQDTLFPVVECHLHYRSPARYDDLLQIQVWVTRAQRVRLNFACRILKPPQTLVLEAETFHVCTGLGERPKRLPADLLARLQPHHHPSPAPA